MKLLKIIGMLMLAIVIMGLANGIASLFDALIPFLGIGVIVMAIVYIALAFVIVRFFIKKILKENLISYRITPPRIQTKFILLGLGLSVFVYAIYLIFVPGDFKLHHFNSIHETLHILFWPIFVQAMAGAFVDELVCRGLLMGYIEKKTNIKVAILSTAIFFAVIHLFNGGLNISSFFLLLISGSLVGIMFGLATYKANTIWASITLHFFWNIFQVLHITEKQSHYNIWEYVVRNHNMAITGGQFGYEVSLISIIGYLIVIFILLKQPKVMITKRVFK